MSFTMKSSRMIIPNVWARLESMVLHAALINDAIVKKGWAVDVPMVGRHGEG